MAFVVADRVKETSTTTGTSSYALAGAVAGFRSFASIGDGNATFYVATDGVDWECGVGTYTAAGTVLARTTVLASSNAGAAVDWAAGTRDIFVADSAARHWANLSAGLLKNGAAGQLSIVTITAAGEALLDDTDASAQLTTLGVATFAKTMLDDTSAGAVLTTLGVSSFVQTLLDDTSAGAARTTLGLVIGTDVLAPDAELTAIAGLTSAADKGIHFTGSGAAATHDLTSFARTLLDDTAAGAARTTLGLGTAATADTGTSDGNVPVYGSGAVNMADKILQRSVLKDTGETKQTVAAASTTDIDLTAGNTVELTQNTNITTFTFSNPPASGTFGALTIIRVKDASGTTRSIVWPASVDWPGGTAPTLTQTTGAVDILVFFTIDGGTRWHGVAASLDSK